MNRFGRRSFHPLGLLLPLPALAGCYGGESLEHSVDSSEVGQQQSALSATGGTSAVLGPAGASGGHHFPLSRKHPMHPDNLRTSSSAVSTGLSLTAQPQDSLAEYARKCEDATGIKVPAFSCENGYEVPQGTVHLNLADYLIGITAGSRTVANQSTVQTITARGAGSLSADKFYFSPIPTVPTPTVSGDGSIEVLVTSLTNTNENAKAGVMFRANSATNAAHVLMAITPGRGAVFQRRVNSGESAVTTELLGRTVPTWLRLTRVGNSFSGFVSADRITWTQVGPTVNVSAISATTPVAGLAVTSNNATQTASATLDKFAWAPANMDFCDRPNVLNDQCDPGSRFQVLAQTGDATAVAHCRKEHYGAGRWGDIAVIQYNKKTGGICFYQALPYDQDGQVIGDGQGVNGTNVPAPAVSSTGTNFRWYTTTEMLRVGCPKCHDNGGFIRSPYLVQTGLLPNSIDGYANNTPVSWVGLDFARERSWSVATDNDVTDQGAACHTCHNLAVNNHAYLNGTAAELAKVATWPTIEQDPSVYLVDSQHHKNPHSITSPIWMRPGQYSYYEPATKTAEKYSNCAKEQWWETSNGTVVSKEDYFTSLTAVPGCTFQPLGLPFTPPSFNDLSVGNANGTRTPSGSTHTFSVRGSGIQGTTDQFLYAMTDGSGNGMATVKINAISSSPTTAKAGLMFRNHIGADAANVMVDITPASGAQLQYRTSDAGNTTFSTPLTPRSAPVWLRLFKTGHVYAGWVSNDNVTWNQVAPALTIPNLSPLAYIGMAATSHNTTTPTSAVFDRFSWLPSQDNLADANIGELNGTQTSSGQNRVIQVTGSGISSTSDQFFYSFKETSSLNTSIIVKVNGIGSLTTSKAGLMFRSSTAVGARYALVNITPSAGAQFQYRSTDNSNASASSALTGWRSPVWLKLTRSGSTFTGSVSTDKQTWLPVSSITINGFPSTALVGLAVTSGSSSSATSATFSNVEMQ